jgi:hypothetical protein
MNKEPKNGLECSEFEALLAEALDDAVAADSRPAFEAHGRSCPVCGPLWSDAREGMLMVRGLVELEPPQNLVHNILAATSRKEATAEQIAEEAKLGWMERLQRSLRPGIGRAPEPAAQKCGAGIYERRGQSDQLLRELAAGLSGASQSPGAEEEYGAGGGIGERETAEQEVGAGGWRTSAAE